MPMFARLSCRDIATSAAWYDEALGFATMFASPDGRMAHLRGRKYQDLMLVPAGEADPSPAMMLSFDVDPDLHALHKKAKAAATVGRSHVADLASTPWGTLEMTVTDPDGHTFVFTQRDKNPEVTARMREQFAKDRGER